MTMVSGGGGGRSGRGTRAFLLRGVKLHGPELVTMMALRRRGIYPGGSCGSDGDVGGELEGRVNAAGVGTFARTGSRSVCLGTGARAKDEGVGDVGRVDTADAIFDIRVL